MLVQRVPASVAVLECPAANSDGTLLYGLNLESRSGEPGVVVTAIDPGGHAARSGALVLGCEITHVNGEAVSSATRVSKLLHSVQADERTTLSLRHPPRGNAYAHVARYALSPPVMAIGSSGASTTDPQYV